MMIVRLNVPFSEVREREDGTIDIALESRDLTILESRLLDELFPDFEVAVGRLLAKQALLKSIK